MFTVSITTLSIQLLSLPGTSSHTLVSVEIFKSNSREDWHINKINGGLTIFEVIQWIGMSYVICDLFVNPRMNLTIFLPSNAMLG